MRIACFLAAFALLCVVGSMGDLIPVDTSVSPCDDFYQYACGVWLNKTVLPPSKPRFARSFDFIGDENVKVLKAILEKNDYPMISTFYQNCMDEQTIDQLGLVPLFKYMLSTRINNNHDLMKAVGYLHTYGVPALFTFSSGPDAKEPLKNIAQLDQANAFSMPDRGLYLGTDNGTVEIQKKYKQFIVNMIQLLNKRIASDKSFYEKVYFNMTLAFAEKPEKMADMIFDFERQLANISLPFDQIRDPLSTANKIKVSELQAMTPSIDWDAYYLAVDAPDFEYTNVAEPKFFKALDKVIANTNTQVLELYLQWRLLQSAANFMPMAFVNASFDFNGRVLQGQAEQEPRSDTCIAATDANLGDILGKYYVAKKFPGKSKDLALEMVSDIMNAFKSVLDGLKWMDNQTKTAALVKLHKVTRRIGYPDVWKNYTGYEVIPGQYLESSFSSNKFQFHKMVRSIGMPVDRTAWEMTADTVNAYYEPTSNSINFPAGIMQDPFFDVEYDAAMNYGGMGMVMGHELTHGFDDQGRMYDGDGALVNWWTKESAAHFEASTTCMAEQYSKFEILPKVFINGNLTLGENIADNGGIKNAFIAYKTKVGDSTGHAKSKVDPKFTNYQVFFLAFAQGWCTKADPAFLKLRIATDVHSPAKFRVIGPLSNLDEFSQVFQCPLGSKMNPKTKCQVW